MSLRDKFKKARHVYFLVECDFDGMVKRWSTRDITVDGDHFFEGKIESIGSIGSSFDLGSFTYSMGGTSVQLINDNRLQDMEVARVLDGSLCNIYIYCAGMTWAEVTGKGLVLTGAFKKDSHTASSYSFTIEDATYRRLRTVPDAYVTDDTFADHRKDGGGGSVSGQAMPLIFGAFTRGIPLYCIDTTGFEYLVSLGPVKSTDAEYTSTAENVYDADGSVIAAAGYTFTEGMIDGRVYQYFDFTSDQVDSEGLSCSYRGFKDGGGVITGTANNLIEHPADISQYLIEKYGIGIFPDLQSLGACKAILPYIKFASFVNNAANCGDIINRLGSQIQSSLVIRNGKYGLITFDPTADPTERMTKQTNHIGGEIIFSRTDIGNVINSLIVNYGLNISTGSYEKQIVRDKDNDEACESSFLQYGERPTVIVALPDVNHDISADVITDRILSIHSHRHDMIDVEVSYADGLDVLEGDAALWTIPEGASSDGSGWVDEKFVLLERTFNPTGISQKWWRSKFFINYAGQGTIGAGYTKDTEGHLILDTTGKGIRDTRRRVV